MALDPALHEQIWPVFAAESREHLDGLSAGVLELERGEGGEGAAERVRRIAHSLKGSAASLGFDDLEELAHGIEDCLAALDGGGRLAAPAAEAILRALEAIEQALEQGDLGNPCAVADRGALLAALRGGPPAPARALAEPVAEPEQPGAPAVAPPAPSPLAALEAAFRRLRAPHLADRAGEASRAAAAARALATALPAGTGPEAERLARALEGMGSGGVEAALASAAAAEALVALQATAAPPAAAAPVAPERPASGPGPDAPPEAGARRDDRSIRVSAGALDALGQQIEVLSRVEARHQRRAREALGVAGAAGDCVALVQRCASELRDGRADAALQRLGEVAARLRGMKRDAARLGREGRRETGQQRLAAAAMREDLRSLRTIPAATVLEPLRRTVRDVAGRLGKDVALVLSGGDVRLDRRVLDELKTPLVHLVRNAIDHGLEAPAGRAAAGKPVLGRLELRVEARGQRVAIVVEDDGAGLSPARIREAAVRRGVIGAAEAARLSDADALRLVFRSGISTAAEVTALSGRGVGLDVVHEAVMRLHGRVDVASEPGRGARFVLDLPLTMSATLGLLFRVGSDVAALPADAVEMVLRVQPGDLATVAGRLTVVAGETTVPFAPLREVLGLPAGTPRGGATALVLASGADRIALAVDGVLGEQELVLTSLGRLGERAPFLAGAAMLDDGLLVGVLDPAELLRRARGHSAADPRPRMREYVVVADDALTTRTAMKSILELAGYAVLPAADGEEALALLRGAPCRLLVSDVQMPRMDGLTLTRHVKADPALARIPVVLVTSLASAEDRNAGLRAGADGYLVKRDVERGKLLELVQQLASAG